VDRSPDESGSTLNEAAREAALTLIVPVYHEAENLPLFVQALEKELRPPFRALVVYDHDDDPTLPVARALAETRPWLQPLKNEIGPGFLNALKTGFRHARQGPVVVMQPDLNDDPSVLPLMLERYRQGSRIVCASRYMPGGQQIGGEWLKTALSRAAGLSLCWLARFPTHDATNNFRLYDAALVEELQIESQAGFALALELTAKAFRRREPIAEVPAVWRDRSSGRSSFRVLPALPHYLRWYAYALVGRMLHR
jgi:dolichol-phosphate mannosyltransferase